MRKTALSALLGLLMLSCLAPAPDSGSGGGGGTSGVGLYAYDDNTKQVFVWKDLSAFYDDAGTPTPTVTLTSSEFDALTPLAWNGMAFDGSRNLLYLVNESGKIVRVNRARSQTGAISSTDALSFKLDTSSPLTNSKFGQAALDSSNNVLYVTENGDNGTRIWMVTNASGRVAGDVVPLSAVQVSTVGGGSGDTGGYGVAAAQSAVYGSFKGGDTVLSNGVSLSGARLRKGSGSTFAPASQVLLGSNTLLGVYGPLGLDTGNSILYAGVHLTDASVSGGRPVLAFKLSQFNSQPNQAPNQLLGSATDLKTLRILAHPGNKDWLVGAPETGTELWLWKQPSLNDSQFKPKTLAGTPLVKAVALDGNG